MKTICLLTFIAISYFGMSQKTGTIKFTAITSENVTPTQSIFQDEETFEKEEEPFSFTTWFDENFFVTKSNSGEYNFVLLVDRKTGSTVYSMVNESTKTIEFYDVTKSLKEMEEMNAQYGDYDTYHYEDEETDTGYQEDFYKTLLNMQPKDTIVLRSDETKEILGYNCKKATLKIKGKTTVTYWYTEELPQLNGMTEMHSSLHGVALAATTKKSGYISELSATELKFEAVPPAQDQMALPEGYLLDLGSEHIYGLDSRSHSNLLVTQPDFVVFEDEEKLLTQIQTEVQKVLKTLKQKEEYSSFIDFEMQLVIDTKGKIQIFQGEGMYNIEDKQMKSLISNLEKNVLVQPATVFGKPVNAKLDLDCSYSVVESSRD